MPRLAYRVNDLPPMNAAAFTPSTFPQPAASSWGLVRLTGSPGTMPVPVPGPKAQGVPLISQDPRTQGGNCSPDVILPDLYKPLPDNMGPMADAGLGLTERRHCPVPIPATSWIPIVKKAMYTPNIGGRLAMDWPRAFQRF